MLKFLGAAAVAVSLFAGALSVAHAVTTEKPIYAKFKGVADKDNPVSDYVPFGKFPDGTDTIQNVGDGVVRFYARAELFKVNSSEPTYMVEELNCRTGMISVIGMGFLPNIKAFEEPAGSYSVKQANSRNLPVYAQICRAVGMKPSW